MKRKFLVSIFVIISLLAVLLLYRNTNLFDKNTDLSDLEFAGLSIHSDDKQVAHDYPDFYMTKKGKFKDYYYEDENYFVVSSDKSTKKVVYIENNQLIKELNLKTNKNIGIGSTKKEVISEYGDKYKKMNSDKYGKVMLYTDKNKHINLAFSLNDKEKVSVVVVYDYKTYDYQW
ncbi:hypothetical protein [Listeria seeligeri]|uniref:hypothetical protein n=1 Tax=Listeria seeligeri TaxID=1640 RepID=UPI0016277A4C|nr:hypothetical protein [Listeria seeligeri]MBC1737159.1 hypothetical protein [Listeria seeligeri]